MSSLRDNILILDCQTTGTSVARHHLLELGWAFISDAKEASEVSSVLLKVPEPLPRIVTEITGIKQEEADQGLEGRVAFETFRASLAGPSATALAHYAQFERPFLEKFFTENGQPAPPELLCTYKIAQRLFPEAPSRNIRGLAGYLGCELPELRRAADHVRATALIWSRMVPELEASGILAFSQLREWLSEKPKKQKAETEKKKPQVQWRMSREKRLALPKGPGIYRMLSKTGEVLYVGKATSLHSRVNSYFRGGVSRDSRKLELMARVYDIEVQECGSPLEAALLENEEIKARAPRYNKALRPSTRSLTFFSRDFSSLSLVQDEAHPLGPFREGSAAHELCFFLRGLAEGNLLDIFFGLVTEENFQIGFALFLAREGLDPAVAPSLRHLIAIGMREYRAWLKAKKLAAEEKEKEAEPGTEEGIEETEEETEVAPEEVADKFLGLCARAAEELRRGKRLGRLLDSEVSWEAGPERWQCLRVRRGRILVEEAAERSPPLHPWEGLKTEDFERMSVLLSELHKFPHRVRPNPRSEGKMRG